MNCFERPTGSMRSLTVVSRAIFPRTMRRPCWEHSLAMRNRASILHVPRGVTVRAHHVARIVNGQPLALHRDPAGGGVVLKTIAVLVGPDLHLESSPCVSAALEAISCGESIVQLTPSFRVHRFASVPIIMTWAACSTFALIVFFTRRLIAAARGRRPSCSIKIFPISSCWFRVKMRPLQRIRSPHGKSLPRAMKGRPIRREARIRFHVFFMFFTLTLGWLARGHASNDDWILLTS